MKTSPSPVLTTERLNLRPLNLEDAAAFHAIAADFDVVKMTGTYPWPFTPAVAKARIAKHMNMNPDDEQVFGIFEGDSLMGQIGLHALTRPARFMLGYHIARAGWGKGIATEACHAILTWGAQKWGPTIVVEAGHFDDNPASGRVLTKAGFVLTGEIKMIHCLSRGKDLPSVEYEWRPGLV